MDQLGPFQDIWDAWNASDAEMRQMPIKHFEEAVKVQFEELRVHIASGQADKAAREAVDIISIAMNLLRRMGYGPERIATLARERAAQRMVGQTKQILAKYPPYSDFDAMG